MKMPEIELEISNFIDTHPIIFRGSRVCMIILMNRSQIRYNIKVLQNALKVNVEEASRLQGVE